MENNNNIGGSERFTPENFKEFLKEYRIEKTKDDLVYKASTLVIASLGLVAALAWEDAAKNIFQNIFGPLDSAGAKVFYAIIATVIAVAASIMLRRIAVKKAVKSKK